MKANIVKLYTIVLPTVKKKQTLLLLSINYRVLSTGTNVAFRKPANQSTTVRGGSASNGNDGEKTTEHDGKRCTETQREASPWWQVDLLRHYAVKVVRVTTRGCCGNIFILLRYFML